MKPSRTDTPKLTALTQEVVSSVCGLRLRGFFGCRRFGVSLSNRFGLSDRHLHRNLRLLHLVHVWSLGALRSSWKKQVIYMENEIAKWTKVILGRVLYTFCIIQEAHWYQTPFFFYISSSHVANGVETKTKIKEKSTSEQIRAVRDSESQIFQS